MTGAKVFPSLDRIVEKAVHLIGNVLQAKSPSHTSPQLIAFACHRAYRHARIHKRPAVKEIRKAIRISHGFALYLANG